MKIGDQATTTRRFSAEDLSGYSALSHHSPAGACIPEPLIGALFSYLLGVQLPGEGTNYLKQETRFHRRVTVGEILTARVEVTRIRAEKCLVDLSTECVDSNGQPVASGRALVLVRKLSQRNEANG